MLDFGGNNAHRLRRRFKPRNNFSADNKHNYDYLRGDYGKDGKKDQRAKTGTDTSKSDTKPAAPAIIAKARASSPGAAVYLRLTPAAR